MPRSPGLASAGATGEMNTNLCEGAQFGGGAVSNGLCIGHGKNAAAQALALTNPAGQQADGTPDFQPIGFRQRVCMTNGIYRAEPDPTSVANMTAIENDFINTSGAPEPATFAMLGGGLVALGALRRRKKSN